MQIPADDLPVINEISSPQEGGDPRVAFAVKLGRALHRYGIPTHRLEQLMNLVLRRLGINGHFFSMPTGILASFGTPEDQRTSLIRVEPSDVDLEKLALLDELAGQVIRGQVSAAEGAARVDRIVGAAPRYGTLLTVLSFAVASGAAARFFSGGWREILASALIGLIVGCLASVVGRSEDATQVFEPAAAILSSSLAIVAARVFSPLSIYVTTLAGVIVLIPGLTVTIAIRELATRNLVSGTARLMGAVLLFLEIGFGVLLGRQLDRLLPPVPPHAEPIPLAAWTLWAALLVAPLAFSVLLRARPHDISWIMAASLLSFGGARAGAYLLGPQLGVFVGAALVGAGSNLYARLLRRPAAIPLVPGILLLVPGSVGFGSFYKFIDRDVLSGVETAFNMILIAIALVTGLLVANISVPPRRAL
ncbi:MAG TPA: threonine/serine exporter family protein [Pyrinomonadaceae bacterium]|jgi:uncharacterized membrane protein YjjP (DUF1212 family)|nr:threonine/serine exporter family protein [Pyrinomonadaceae bacterium]